MPKSCLDLTGRVAVIFGGTSGLGKAIALGLAEHGATAIPTGRRAPELASVCAELRTLGHQAFEQTCDARDPASIEDLRSQILAKFGRADILVNAAGITFRKPTTQVTKPEWDNLFATNLTATLQTCQAFYPALKSSGAGRIINIASLGSFVAFHEVAAYCASKSAILSLTRSLACEWARDGISVNAIAPGVFPTQLNSHLLEGTPRGKEILMRTPMGRFGNAQELVGAAVLLASDGASFITGQCLAVDGGYLASGVNV